MRKTITIYAKEITNCAKPFIRLSHFNKKHNRYETIRFTNDCIDNALDIDCNLKTFEAGKTYSVQIETEGCRTDEKLSADGLKIYYTTWINMAYSVKELPPKQKKEENNTPSDNDDLPF